MFLVKSYHSQYVLWYKNHFLNKHYKKHFKLHDIKIEIMNNNYN
jgi:hypothetical protein